jgi:thioredoxin-related protein
MGCVALKPAVDRLEQQLGSGANTLRVSVTTPAGRELASRYGFQYVPQFVIYDGAGRQVYSDTALPTVQQVLSPS